MEPAKYTFTCKRGTTFQRKLRFKDVNDNIMDLTGYTARMQVREEVESEDTLLDLTSGDGIEINEERGLVSIQIEAAVTSELPLGSWKYDLELETEDGIVYCPLYGTFKVTAEVTR